MELIERYPEHLRECPEFAALQGAIGAEVARVRENLRGILAQADVLTATWGLGRWEAQVGVTAEAGDDDDARRARVMCRLRAQQATTAQTIAALAALYSGGEAEVLEYPAESRFEVHFLVPHGTPPGIAALAGAIEAAKPAHLAYSFTYSYTTYGELSAYTHGQLAAYTHDQIKEEAL